MTNEQRRRASGQTEQIIKVNQTWERIDTDIWIRIKEVTEDRVLVYDAESDNVLFSPNKLKTSLNLSLK